MRRSAILPALFILASDRFSQTGFSYAPLFCCGTILKLSDERSSSIRIIPGPVSSFHHHPVVLAFPLSRPPAFPIYPPGDRIESTIQTHFRWCILCRLRLILFISALKQERLERRYPGSFNLFLSFSIFQSLDRRRRFPSYLPSSTSSNSASSISESPPIFTIFSFSSLALRILRMEYWLSRSVTP